MRYVLSLVGALFATQTMAASGAMDCEITFQQVFVMEDGKPKLFTGFTDSLEVGDRLYFTYGYGPYAGINMTIADAKTREKIFHSTYTKDLNVSTSGNVLNGYAQFGSALISQDWMRGETYSQNITFNRYFKNDYEGILTRLDAREMQTYTVGMDCRNVKDGVDEVLEKAKKFLRK